MQNNPNPDDERLRRSPDLKDVEPGSDADETPAPDTEKPRSGRRRPDDEGGHKQK